MFSFPRWPAISGHAQTPRSLARTALWTIVLLLATGSLAHAAVSGPPKTWKLLFVRAGDIWISNGDGTAQHLLIKNGDVPCWSPDKKLIAFERDNNIWVAHADSTHQRGLTRWKNIGPKENGADRFVDGRDDDISWDPIDNLITFSRWEQFYVVREGDKNGKMVVGCSIYDVPLHPTADTGIEVFFDLFDDQAFVHFSDNGHPAWSRSGKYMAFVRNGDIWLVTRAGMQADPHWAWAHKTWTAWRWENTRLAAVASYDAPTYRGSRENYFPNHLAWSPNGKLLAYSIGRINGSDWLETRIAHVNGSGDGLSLAGDKISIEDADDPAFSPDGKFVAYWNRSTGGISVMTLSTRRVTNLIANGSSPAW